MPKAWMTRSPTNTKRALYCERQLRAHRSFVNAPTVGKDDFKEFLFEQEGMEMDADGGVVPNESYAMYEVSRVWEELAKAAGSSELDLQD
eukprot:127896-Pleurochrysis_carterae.AAC.1